MPLFTQATKYLLLLLSSTWLSLTTISQVVTDSSLQAIQKTTILGDTSMGMTSSDSLVVAPSYLQNMVDALATEVNGSGEDEIGLEIDGLIVKDTRTKHGGDFYDHFYRNWEAPPNARNFTITIKELPYRLNMTMILVKINDNEIFRSALQPRREIIISLADYALSRAEEFLINYEDIMKQLGGEDQTGTGIY
jgi:curli production assembly/transport component CsgE